MTLKCCFPPHLKLCCIFWCSHFVEGDHTTLSLILTPAIPPSLPLSLSVCLVTRLCLTSIRLKAWLWSSCGRGSLLKISKPALAQILRWMALLLAIFHLIYKLLMFSHFFFFVCILLFRCLQIWRPCSKFKRPCDESKMLRWFCTLGKVKYA